MSGWDDIEVEGEDFGESAGTLVGVPASGFFEEKTWDDGRVSTTLWLTLVRTHPELTPNAPVESKALWNCGPGWLILDPQPSDSGVNPVGQAVYHTEGKTKFNANTGVGKLLVAVKAVYPEPPEGFDPTTIKSWLDLADQGDVEWGQLEEAPLMPNPDKTAAQKFIPNTAADAKPKRTRVPVKYLGDGASNGQASDVDLASLDLGDTLDAVTAAAKGAAPGKDGMVQALVQHAMKNPKLYQVLNENPEGLRYALTGEM